MIEEKPKVRDEDVIKEEPIYILEGPGIGCCVFIIIIFFISSCAIIII